MEIDIPTTAIVVERHELMEALDVTTKWELLTPEDLAVAEPMNQDDMTRPQMKLNAPTNLNIPSKKPLFACNLQGCLIKWATSEILNPLGEEPRLEVVVNKEGISFGR